MEFWSAVSTLANVVCVIALIKGFMKYCDMVNEQRAKWQALFDDPASSVSVRTYALEQIKALVAAGAVKVAP